MPNANSVILELHVEDFELAKSFYVGLLGFEVVRPRTDENEENYLVMRRDNNVLCFWPGNEAVYQHPYFKRYPGNTLRGYGVEIVVMIPGVESFYEQVKDLVNVVAGLQLRTWGRKDFRVVDPFGFYLRFSEPYDVLLRPQLVP